MGLVKSDQKPTILTWTVRTADDDEPGLWKYGCSACGIVVSNVELGDTALCPKDNVELIGGSPVALGTLGVDVSLAIPDATDIATESE